MDLIKKNFTESIDIKKEILSSDVTKSLISMGESIVSAVRNGNKVIFCGNGGSAADSQHLAAEMLIRLKSENNREGIPAIALAQDTSTITACGNDYGFDYLYQRLIETLGNKGDILIAISTSGNSNNIIRAIKAANLKEIKAFGFFGNGGGKAISFCDESFVVPSSNTARIQESHITAGHALVEFVENKLIDIHFLNLK
tara:strand:+ start:3292 stop:3888 length:597 start_codon:yes stop_codon:yes gene_type:complete